MENERYARVKALFLAACDLEPSQRDGFLAAECGDDDLLRIEVDALLVQMTGSPTYAGPLAMRNASSLPNGSLIASRYRVDAELGAGGMGRVYRATQLALSREVAIKVLSSRAVATPDALVRFEREAAAVARLRHPNIVTIYDAGSDERAGAFYAMELVEGRSLADEIADGGGLPLAEALEVMRQVTSAVRAAHKAGIIHRDLKPANVVLDRSAGLTAKVLDFGIAKLVDEETSTTIAGSSVTASGAVFGTPLYMSPEQACAEHVDARTDVWSLGVMLYELIAGTPPFRSDSPAATFAAILREEPEPLDKVVSGVPESLAELVTRTLQKDRDDRLSTAGELELALGRIASGLDSASTIDTIRIDARDTEHKHLRDAEPEPEKEPVPEAEPVPEPEPAPEPALAPAPAPEDRPGRRTAIVAAVAIAVALVGGVGLVARMMTRSATPPPAPPVAAPAAAARSLEYAIEVQKYRDGAPYQEPFRLAREVVFEKDYRIRLLVSSTDPGSLYVLNEAPPEVSAEPTFNILFPSPTTNGGRSEIAPGATVQLPERGWLRFDAERGTETLWLVWSERPIVELDALTSFVNPTDRGAVTDASKARAIRELLAADRPQTETSRNDATKTTVLRATGGLLVYKLLLEHQ